MALSVLGVAGRNWIISGRDRVFASNPPVASLDCQLSSPLIDKTGACRVDSILLSGVAAGCSAGTVSLVDPLAVRVPVDHSILILTHHLPLS